MRICDRRNSGLQAGIRSENVEARALMPEVQTLISSRGRPTDPEFQSQLQTVREKLGQSNDVGLLVSNGQALVTGSFRKSYTAATRMPLEGPLSRRALQLDPGSVAAREAQVSAERSLLMSARWNPEDTEARKRLAYIAGELAARVRM